jgi:hypothetical protein
MKYNTNESGFVANYATIGGVENEIEYKGELTDDFKKYPSAYRVIDGVLVVDETRRAEIIRSIEAVDILPENHLERRVAELESSLADSLEALNILLGE